MDSEKTRPPEGWTERRARVLEGSVNSEKLRSDIDRARRETEEWLADYRANPPPQRASANRTALLLPGFGVGSDSPMFDELKGHLDRAAWDWVQFSYAGIERPFSKFHTFIQDYAMLEQLLAAHLQWLSASALQVLVPHSLAGLNVVHTCTSRPDLRTPDGVISLAGAMTVDATEPANAPWRDQYTHYLEHYWGSPIDYCRMKIKTLILRGGLDTTIDRQRADLTAIIPSPHIRYEEVARADHVSICSDEESLKLIDWFLETVDP